MWLQIKLKEKKTKILSWFLFLIEMGDVFPKKDLGIGFLTRKTLQNP